MSEQENIQIEIEEYYQKVQSALFKEADNPFLLSRERHLLNLYYGNRKRRRTLEDIALQIGCTRAIAQQRKNNGLRKLRERGLLED